MSKDAFTKSEDLNLTKSVVFNIDPDDLTLITDPDHHLYDSRVHNSPDDSLVTNILFEGQGVLQPIVITKEDGKPVVVAGRQRTIAAREANRQLRAQGIKTVLRVPCVYRRGTEQELYNALVSENEQRRDDDPIEKAKKINRMINFGSTKNEVAKVFGVTRPTIDNWLSLLDLDSESQEKVSKREIKPSAAVKISKMKKSEQKGAVKVAAKKKRKSVRKYDEIAGMLDDIRARKVETNPVEVLEWVLKIGEEKGGE